MKLPLFLLVSILILTATVPAQDEVAAASYFPAENELGGSLRAVSDAAFADAASLAQVDNGRLISDIGFARYARRVYSAGNSSSLSIEMITLLDSRAAYSLLTLLRNTTIKPGPPGDAFTAGTQAICFAHQKQWVRMRGVGISEDLIKKIAISISNRMGTRLAGPPSLVSHLPKTGYDASSLRYFPLAASYKTYAQGKVPAYLNLMYDMEIVQARYFAESRSGNLYLLKFPTPELAEEYYNELAVPPSEQRHEIMIYAKRVGPLVACLEGNLDPSAADNILKSIKFGYSVRWVEEKGNNSRIVWGVPIGILGAVVNSFLFVAMLCVASVLLGAGFAMVRFMLRGFTSRHSSNPEESSDITQLRLR